MTPSIAGEDMEQEELSLFWECKIMQPLWKTSRHLTKLSKLLPHPQATVLFAAAAAAKSLQLCPTLYDPIDGSPPSYPVPGILQASTLEWVAISFSNEWKQKVKVKSLSHVRLFATPWTAAHQAPPSMGFSRREYWSGVLLKRMKYCHLQQHEWTQRLSY